MARRSSGCAPRPRPRARCSRRASPSTPSTCATPSAGSHPDVRVRGARARPTPRASRATTTWASGRRRRPAAAAACTGAVGRARAGGPVGEVLDGVLAGEEVGVDEIVTLLEARGPEVAARRRGRRRAAPRDRRRHRHVRPQPQHQLHERLHVQVPVLRVLEGPAVAQPAGHAVPARARGDPAPRASRPSTAAPPRSACRAASTPTSTATTTSTVARAVKEVAPEIHVHGFTALEVTEGARRLGMPLARLPASLAKDAGLATLAGHRGRDPRRRGARRSSAPTRSTPRSGSTRTAPRTRSGCARTSRSCSATSSARSTWPATSCAPATLQKETGGFTEFVPLPFVHMATPIFLQKQGAPRARRSARCCSCTRSAASRTAASIDNIQASWVKTGVPGARQAAAGRAATTSAAR